MPKIITRCLGSFLVFLILVAVFISACLIFSAEAQEQTEIFPAVFSGDLPGSQPGWQNPEAVFSQDLGEEAGLEDFNKENSAYPLMKRETDAKQERETDAKPEEIEPSSVIATTTEPVATTTEQVATSTNLTEIGSLATSTDSNSNVWTSDAQTLEATTTTTTTTTTSASASANATSTGFWQGLKDLLKISEAMAAEQRQEAGTEGLVLVVSDFTVPQEVKAKEIKNVQLRMSLAGKGEAGDKLLIEYYYQNVWQEVVAFDLQVGISNALNGGYFLYGLPIFENWDDVENLQIRFTYQRQATRDKRQEVFLDAVWLEVETSSKRQETLLDSKHLTGQAPLDSEHLTGQARDKEYELKLISDRTDFKINDKIEFKFQYQEKQGIVELMTADIMGVFGGGRGGHKSININSVKAEISGMDIAPEVFLQADGQFKVELPDKPRQFKPGKYKMRVEIEDPLASPGQVQEFEQNFTWGVLAINTNKSIYLSAEALAKADLPPEQAYIQIAALRDDGHTICDARLRLQIRNPKSPKQSKLATGQAEIRNLSTRDGTIQYSGKCQGNNITNMPDYFAYYEVGEPGTYQMTLTNLDNGYEITDYFEVRGAVLFDIERIGPTRIYPPAEYQMRFKIKTEQDFVGEVIEYVPDGFEIIETSDPEGDSSAPYGASKRQETRGEEKLIIWQVDWQAGETYELKYAFDAPNISPYLYLLGPLEFYE